MSSPIFNPKKVPPSYVLPKYTPTGDGRDLWCVKDLISSPYTGTVISLNKNVDQPPPSQTPVRNRTAGLPRFVPNGSGRDLFQQCGNDPLISHAGVTTFSANPPVYPRSGLGVNRQGSPPPKYVPGGSGRDLYLCRTGPNVSTFAKMRTERPVKAPRARTSPPPRCQTTGSGRDTYLNSTISTDSVLSRSSKQVEGFAYGDVSISRSNNLRHRQIEQRYRERTGETITAAQQQMTFTRLISPPKTAESRSRPDPSRSLGRETLLSPMNRFDNIPLSRPATTSSTVPW